MTESYSLKEIQLRLNTKQHVLIHLCEKGVIEPSVETDGRGVPREFSVHNLFEFALALNIRSYGIPVATAASVVRLVKSFERSVQKKMKGFSLLDYLSNKKSKDITLYLYDGKSMVCSFGGSLISFDLIKIINSPEKPIRTRSLDELPKEYASYLHISLKKTFEKTK